MNYKVISIKSLFFSRKTGHGVKWVTVFLVYFLPRPFPLGKDVVNMLQLSGQGSEGEAYKSELWLVDTVHEGYLAWALIGRNKFTVQAYVYSCVHKSRVHLYSSTVYLYRNLYKV